MAQAEAKLITDFLLAVGAWPTREHQERLFQAVPKELKERHAAMVESRKVRLAMIEQRKAAKSAAEVKKAAERSDPA
jgi:hypothetical protein